MQPPKVAVYNPNSAASVIHITLKLIYDLHKLRPERILDEFDNAHNPSTYCPPEVKCPACMCAFKVNNDLVKKLKQLYIDHAKCVEEELKNFKYKNIERECKRNAGSTS